MPGLFFSHRMFGCEVLDRDDIDRDSNEDDYHQENSHQGPRGVLFPDGNLWDDLQDKQRFFPGTVVQLRDGALIIPLVQS